MIGKVVPKKHADNDPIPTFRQAEEFVLKLIKAPVNEVKNVIESMNEESIDMVGHINRRLMLMTMNGWSQEDGKISHDSGISVESDRFMVEDGYVIVKKNGKRLNVDTGRLHYIRETVDNIKHVLDLERKLDLFKGVKELQNGR